MKLNEPQWLEQRERVIETFTRQAREQGLRAVSMSGLAKHLGISTKTLYRHFPSKFDLLRAVVESHIQAFNQRRMDRILRGENAHRRIESMALEWLDLQTELGEGFVYQLERDFPEAYALYQESVSAFLGRARNTLRSEIRQGLNPDHALMLLWDLINRTPSYQACERLGMIRRQALVQAIAIWARGSLAMYA